MSKYELSLVEKFKILLNKKKVRTPDPQESFFWVKLFISKDIEAFTRELEINGYRLAYDTHSGFTAVHFIQPAYFLERIAPPGSLGRMKLGDLSTLPSAAEAKETFSEHMIKVLPGHIKSQANEYREYQSFLLKDIRELHKLEKAGDLSARMARDSLIQLASWGRREHTLEKARLRDNIYSHKVDLRLGRVEGKSQGKDKGLGMSY